MEYSEHELRKHISYFVMERSKTAHLDFKQEWHEKMEDLIKDIICFANTVHDKDCFLVFGISDSYQIVGMTKRRRKLSDIINTLNNLHFAGDIVPKVELKTISMDGKDIDVLIIKNTDLTPIYLKKPYGKMKEGCIYTRSGNKNTPNNGNADYNEIEMLWKKRFGLTIPPLEFIYKSMENKLNWRKNETGWYHFYKPENYIHKHKFSKYDSDSDCSKIIEFYSHSQTNESTSYMQLDIMANQTLLESYQIVRLNDGKLTIPLPEFGFIENEDDPHDFIRYRYFVKGTNNYSLLKFLYDPDNAEQYDSFKHLMNVILMFSSEEERIDFEEFVVYNYDYVKELIAETNEYDYIEAENETETEMYSEELNMGFVLKEILKMYRTE